MTYKYLSLEKVIDYLKSKNVYLKDLSYINVKNELNILNEVCMKIWGTEQTFVILKDDIE